MNAMESERASERTNGSFIPPAQKRAEIYDQRGAAAKGVKWRCTRTRARPTNRSAAVVRLPDGLLCKINHRASDAQLHIKLSINDDKQK